MLNSAGLGSDILWKGTVPFKEKHFTITLFVAFAVVLPLPPPSPPPLPLLFYKVPPQKGCLFFVLITSVITSIDCAFSFNIAVTFTVDVSVTPRSAYVIVLLHCPINN